MVRQVSPERQVAFGDDRFVVLTTTSDRNRLIGHGTLVKGLDDGPQPDATRELTLMLIGNGVNVFAIEGEKALFHLLFIVSPHG